jgi:branched-chain amino acid aminotransferase
MPSFPIDRFGSVIEEMVRRNSNVVPAPGEGSLYLRPILFAVEPKLGLGRCRQFSMTVYASPVGDFFSHHLERSLRLEVLDRGRAAPGLGTAKCSANYAAVLAALEASRAKGFNDVVFIDQKLKDSNQQIFITETSGANLFVRLESGHLVTPPLDDQLFPGITRDSVLRVAREVLGITTEERPISLEEIFEVGEEVFCTGTAWSIASIGEIEHRGSAKKFSTSETQRLISSVSRGVQTGRHEDLFGWVREVGGTDDDSRA